MVNSSRHYPQPLRKFKATNAKLLTKTLLASVAAKVIPANKGVPELNKRGKKRVINQELAGSSVKKNSSAMSSN